jgi:hypothetical protein
MYLKHVKFDHSQEDMFLAMCSSPQQITRVRERIIFHTINHHLNLINGYFDNMDEAPKEMKTSSGLLTNLLQEITDQAEYELTLFNFSKLEKVADSMMKAYVPFIKKDKFPNHVRLMIESKLEEASEEYMKENKDNPSANATSPMSLFKRIELVEKSSGSFDNYMRLYAKLNLEPHMYSDVDDLLSNCFNFD